MNTIHLEHPYSENLSPFRILHPRSFDRGGFSTLEIVIVIAIVVALAGILFPIYFKVRDSADRIGCQTNLRSLQLAAASFILETRTFPDWEQWYFASPTGFREYFSPTSAGHGDRFLTVATSPFLQRRWPSWSVVSHTYAMNFRLSDHSSYSIKHWGTVEEPQRMVHFMFGVPGNKRADGSHFYTPFLYHLNGNGSIAKERYFDNGYSNIVYADGHVDRISRKEGQAMARHNNEASYLFWRGRRN